LALLRGDVAARRSVVERLVDLLAQRDVAVDVLAEPLPRRGFAADCAPELPPQAP
jgi:hypothetical protein